MRAFNDGIDLLFVKHWERGQEIEKERKEREERRIQKAKELNRNIAVGVAITASSLLGLGILAFTDIAKIYNSVNYKTEGIQQLVEVRDEVSFIVQKYEQDKKAIKLWLDYFEKSPDIANVEPDGIPDVIVSTKELDEVAVAKIRKGSKIVVSGDMFNIISIDGYKVKQDNLSKNKDNIDTLTLVAKTNQR